MKTIALTGGGTAGHIMPNLALIPELRRFFDRVIYLGAGGMEEKLAKERGIAFFKTEAIRLERKAIWKNAKIPFVLSGAAKDAAKILKREGVCAVFSKGGYVALPASIAAKRLKIPLIVHESDYTMGVANKLAARFADAALTSFPETKGGVYIGNPVRDEIFIGNPERLKRELKFDKKPVLLVVGGSLGAEALNRVVRDNLNELLKEYNILHIAGKGHDPSIRREGYQSYPMTNRIPDLYAAADVVLTRAGANTLTELAALKKRTVAVPLPKGASRGDQVDNAKSFEKRGLLKILDQSDLSIAALTAALRAAPRIENGGARVIRETNRKIAELIAETVGKKENSARRV